jgi:hypothetical protein
LYGNARFFLFGLGITFSAVFRLAKDIFVLGRFYILVDSLYTNVTEGLKMPLGNVCSLLTLRLTTALTVGTRTLPPKYVPVGTVES